MIAHQKNMYQWLAGPAATMARNKRSSKQHNKIHPLIASVIYESWTSYHVTL